MGLFCDHGLSLVICGADGVVAGTVVSSHAADTRLAASAFYAARRAEWFTRRATPRSDPEDGSDWDVDPLEDPADVDIVLAPDEAARRDAMLAAQGAGAYTAWQHTWAWTSTL
jgi:hypothetical protein